MSFDGYYPSHPGDDADYLPAGGEPDQSTRESGYSRPAADADQQWQYDPYWQPYHSPLDPVSVAALITGVLGLAVIPLMLGIVGLRRTHDRGTRGRGFAIAGIVLGALAAIAGVILVTLAFSGGLSKSSSPLDALHTKCAAGDWSACDDLFDQASAGSREEMFGQTCGGRVQTDQYCVDVMPTLSPASKA